MALRAQGLRHLGAKLDALSTSCSLGYAEQRLEDELGDVLAAIEYVAWRLQLDWDAINARSAAETLRLQQADAA